MTKISLFQSLIISIFFFVSDEFLSDPITFLLCLWLQPHGFFNCSPAVDVPPNACELDTKETDVKDAGVVKPIQNGILAKL